MLLQGGHSGHISLEHELVLRHLYQFLPDIAATTGPPMSALRAANLPTPHPQGEALIFILLDFWLSDFNIGESHVTR